MLSLYPNILISAKAFLLGELDNEVVETNGKGSLGFSV